ncbi:MAG: hypothetical protein IJN48_02335 [Clostridia bacterium]|nr:hypothetical protein [Clostridia bacterium]
MKKINVVDLLIVLVLIAAVAVVAALGFSEKTVEEDKYIITLELMEKRAGFSENVIVGDTVVERVQHLEIGVITDVYAIPCERTTYDRVTGEPLTVTIPEREDIYITMEIEDASTISVGKVLSIITKHFTGSGYVIGKEKAE